MLEDMAREAIPKKGIFELRQEGTAMQWESQGEVTPGRRNSACKGPEAGKCLKIQQGGQGSYRGKLKLGKQTGVSHPGPWGRSKESGFKKRMLQGVTSLPQGSSHPSLSPAPRNPSLPLCHHEHICNSLFNSLSLRDTIRVWRAALLPDVSPTPSTWPSILQHLTDSQQIVSEWMNTCLDSYTATQRHTNVKLS